MTDKIGTMSDAVKIVIDRYPKGHRFFGNELKDDVAGVFPDARRMYPDTVLRMARRHRRRVFVSVDRNRSLYERV
jgi:hypothetical protein